MIIKASCVTVLLLVSVLASATDQALDVYAATVSPDASRVAWIQQVNREKPDRTIFVQNLTEPIGTPVAIKTGLAGTNIGKELTWSPDGRSLAFLSGGYLYVQQVSEGAARRLAIFSGAVASPAWSPDGKFIAVLLTENASGVQAPNAPKAIASSATEEHSPRQRIATVEVVSGIIRQISPLDLYVHEYDWSPDSKSFAAIAAYGEGDNNWYIAELYTIAMSGDAKSIYKPSLQMAVPRWSPDGGKIAVIQGIMSDEGLIGGDVFLVPLSGEPQNLTPKWKASAAWLSWKNDTQILVSESIDGVGGLATLDSSSGQLAAIPGDLTARVNGLVSVAKNGNTSALIVSSFEHPPEVWAGELGSWKQVSHVNTAVEVAWGKAESLHWQNDSFQIQGWLLRPLHVDPARKYPMVVAIHGGPTSMARSRWPNTAESAYIYRLTALSRSGYFIFFPNFRGSTGQGEAFAQANVKDFGYGDFKDILAGVDAVVRAFPVDPNRIGLAGWSYGGYVAMWSVTQTQRFGAVVAGAGIANWQSYYGQSAIDKWMIPFFGTSPYDDPAVYRRSSPMEFIKQVKTPVLMLVGEQDGECPLPQSQEFWHALKSMGVNTRLVVYPGEGHTITGNEHRRDVLDSTVAWFNQYLVSRK